MHHGSVLRLVLVFGLFSLSACQCGHRPTVETPIEELRSCPEDERCETGLCDSVLDGGKICLRPCLMGCRNSDICTKLPGDRYACVPERAGLCKTCTTDSDCPQPADRCIVLGDQRFCGRDCSYDQQCPSSFRCAEATTVSGERVPSQCQPTSGTCDCISASAGQQVACDVRNGFGTCTGVSVCRPPEGYSACSARTPTAEVCNGVDDDCNGMTDENLGDVTCGQGECQRAVAACANGIPQNCVAGDPGAERCNGRDDDCDGTVDDGFDLQTNPQHCGACNAECVLPNAVPGCAAGQCTIARCTPGWSDLDRTVSNGCEYPCTPSDGGVEICDGLDNDCNGLVDDGFDLTSDPSNCGQCNLVCSLPVTTVSTYACVARVCGIGQCAGGRGNCNQQYADGCEVDLTADVAHCGQCGSPCVTPNATPLCAGGMCGIAMCAPGFDNCNGQVADGCEVNTNTSLTNCGACGTTCNAANATNSCTAGQCGFTCQPNWWNADGQAANGCEYACIRTAGGVEACDSIDNDCDSRVDEDFDLTSNPQHCGQCNRACSAPFATTACSASSCGITSCDPGRANCNNAYLDGCEVDTTSTLAHCGGCGLTCTTPNATPRCSGGACGIQQCNAGFADCNSMPGDGCEVNTGNSLQHCGGCGQQCAPANSNPACVAGACGIASCQPGWVNQNGLVSDGCEYACTPSNGSVEICDGRDNDCDGQTDEGFSLATDVNNCGACGTVCSAPNVTVPRCTAGACGVQQCANGFQNCDAQFSNGCEVNTTNSVANCGSCGNLCNVPNAVNACTNGSCTFTCPAGRWDVDGQASNGCEYACTVSNGGTEICDSVDNDCDGTVDEGFTLATDVNNCGACGTVCSAQNVTVPRCVSGSCAIQQCATGFQDCDNQFSNGCEVNVTNSLANCGSCGNLCNVPNAVNACTNGSCTFTCPAGRWNLDGNPANGCEYACTVTNSGTEICDSVDNDCDGTVDEGFTLATDVNNCGACGNVCSAQNVTVPRCTSGSCGVQQCANGYANCDNQFSNGCEVNTTNTLAHCGACGNVCNVPNAINTCVNSACAFSCPPNRWNIDGNASNGCEYACTPSNGGVESCDSLDNDCDGAIDEGFTLASDVNNCGACGNVCTAPNVTVPRCSSGTCGVQQCANGYTNCNGAFSDGCEINTNSDTANCGGCGVTCAPPNATGVCSGGSCLVGSCNGTNRNCNNLPGDGCEVDIATSVNNCGGCGVTCNTPNANNFCSNGSCGFACPANRWNLDGDASNGCEYVCTFLSSTDQPDLNLVDANCDGIDGEIGNSIFVAPSAAGGSDSNPGTRAAPKMTISAGLSAARTGGKRDVLVAGGTYLEQVFVNEANKGVFGGYTAGSWARSLATAVTVTGVNTPLRIADANGAVVQAVNFVGASASGVSGTAYGALVTNSTMVRLERVNITAGNGTGGTSGSAGSNGAAGGAGGKGAPGCEDSGGFCSGCGRPGVGAGGTSACGRTGGAGGIPGHGGNAGSMGQPGVTSTGGPGTPQGQGNWTTPSTYWGANGAPGGDGSNGANAASFGVITIGGYAVATAIAGSDGTDGNGGGGGGGGGGGNNDCDSYGGAGSGGGGGGCKATGGGRGTSGGGSFGIVLWASTVQATDVNVTSAFGGNGGNGALGGTGGNGGAGGAQNDYGGSGEQDDGSNGGRGGAGGRGGHGGHGGAGAGGPSVGVARGGGAAWSAVGGSITVGLPGAGGTSPLGTAPTGTVTSLY